MEIPTVRPTSKCELIIESKTTVRYLGLTIDSKMSFITQITAAADKVAAVFSALIRLMVNLGS